MRLHLPGLPHTVTNEEFSHCAFTAKILKFAKMMKPHGYEIIHYGVEGATTEASTQVDLMTAWEQTSLRGFDNSDKTRFIGEGANVNTELYLVYNNRLREELKKRVQPEDLVLLPFGHGHAQAVQGLGFRCVESGIGYATLCPLAAYKIFESFCWQHFHLGRQNELNGHNYEWVVPNYFDLEQWRVNFMPQNYIAFLGRIFDLKGLKTIQAIAHARPNEHFIIAGQGDPKPYLTEPNIEYRPPMVGRERETFLGNARAILMPSVFIEPFCGAAVEAMLCGTPVISTPFGAFTETVEDQVTGFRCHTLGDFCGAVDRVGELDRAYIAARARRLYGFERVGKMYHRVFQQIDELRRKGWYCETPTF